MLDRGIVVLILKYLFHLICNPSTFINFTQILLNKIGKWLNLEDGEEEIRERCFKWLIFFLESTNPVYQKYNFAGWLARNLQGKKSEEKQSQVSYVRFKNSPQTGPTPKFKCYPQTFIQESDYDLTKHRGHILTKRKGK